MCWRGVRERVRNPASQPIRKLVRAKKKEVTVNGKLNTDIICVFVCLRVCVCPPSDVPSNGLYFLTYEYVKHFLTPEGQRSVISHLQQHLTTSQQDEAAASSSVCLCVFVWQCHSAQHSQHPCGWRCGRDPELDDRPSPGRPEVQLPDG